MPRALRRGGGDPPRGPKDQKSALTCRLLKMMKKTNIQSCRYAMCSPPHSQVMEIRAKRYRTKGISGNQKQRLSAGACSAEHSLSIPRAGSKPCQQTGHVCQESGTESWGKHGRAPGKLWECGEKIDFGELRGKGKRVLVLSTQQAVMALALHGVRLRLFSDLL